MDKILETHDKQGLELNNMKRLYDILKAENANLRSQVQRIANQLQDVVKPLPPEIIELEIRGKNARNP